MSNAYNQFICIPWLLLALLTSTVLSAPPTITGLPDSISIKESVTPSLTTALYTMTVSDPDGNAFFCSVPSTSPSGFLMDDIGSGPQLFLSSNPGFEHDVAPEYTLTITCTDDLNEQSTGDLTVYILENSPPAISNLPATATVNDGEATNLKLFDLTVTDTETDPFSCFISSTGPFSYQSSPTRSIYLNAGHSLDADTVSLYNILVNCSDPYGFSTRTLTVTVTKNSPPQFTNLPDSVSFPERGTGGITIFSVTVSDPETDTFVCTLSSVPVSTLFYLDKTTVYEVKIQTSPIFSVTSYALTITCFDAHGSSSSTLTVNILPNSAPSITGLPAGVTIYESDPAGTDVYSMTVSDVESDPFTCSISSVNPASSAFTMVPPGTQYKVQLALNHGLEADTTSSYDLTLECTDGKTSSGILTVVVQSNTPPAIASTPTDPANVATGETAERTLYTLSVTDTDVFSCTMTSSPAGPFSLVYSSPDYLIKMNSNPTFASTSYILNVTCADPYGSTSQTFSVTVAANQPPVISNLPASETVLETETAARCLKTVLVTDSENQTITCGIVSDPAGPFSMIQDASVPVYNVCLDANAISSLDGLTNPSHVITVTCSDTSGGSHVGNLSVTVTVNNAPVISGLPDIVQVFETENTERNIWDLSVVDPDNDAFICQLTTAPVGAPFDMRKNTTNSVYSTFLLSSPNLNYSITPSYTLNFTCTDSPKGRSSSQILTVDVVENRPPTFLNLAGAATQDALATSSGAQIFDVDADDLDNDVISYSMTVSPNTDSFSISSTSGIVTAARDLQYELTKEYVVNVTASDGKRSTTASLTITLDNLNTAPIISNMALHGEVNIYISESTAPGTVLFTATPYDPIGGQTPVTTMFVDPSGEFNTFNLTNHVISLANGRSFDYEYLTRYRVTFYVSDTLAETGPYYLMVNILNEPEVCSFPKERYQYHISEGGRGAGKVNLNLTSTIIDDDNPDTHTFSLITSTYSNLFDIDASTGIITFAVNYDIDRSHPQNCTLRIKCEDKYGQTGTSTLTLYIADVNDNTPNCNREGYVCIVTQYTKKGSRICSVNTTDLDQLENAEVEYHGSSPTGVGFASVTKSGDVYTTRDIGWDSFDTLRFTILAIDHGTPPLTGTCYVDIFYRETSTTSTTTTTVSYDDWWSKPEHIIMVAALAAIGLLLLALLAYLCYKYGSTGFLKACKNPFKNLKCCKKEKPLKVKNPKNPKAEKFKLWDANDLNKMREPYSTGNTESSIPQTMKL